MQSSTEIECKYVISFTDKDAAVKEIMSFVDSVADQHLNWRAAVHEDSYYDTDDRVILKSGSSLRIRNRNGTRKCTFKSHIAVRDGLFERTEDENTVSTDDVVIALRSMNDDSVNAVGRITSGRELKRTLAVVNHRRKADIIIGDCEIEFVIDDITYNGIKNELQVEIELMTNEHPEEYERFVKRFEDISKNCKTFIIMPMTESKYERGMKS